MAAELPLSSVDTVRRAWGVLIGAFLAFLLLLTSLMSGAYIYGRSATQEREGRLETIGDVLLQARNEKSFRQARSGELVREGDTVKTQSGAQARLVFLDGSVAMQLAEETVIQVDELRTSRFVNDEKRLRVSQAQGWSWLMATPATDYDIGRYLVVIDGLRVEVETPRGSGAQLNIELRPREWQWRNDQLVSTTPLEPRISVWEGGATLRQGDDQVHLAAGQTTVRSASGALVTPTASQREYVRNGRFLEPPAIRDRDRQVARQWRVTTSQGGDGGDRDGRATTVQKDLDGQPVPVVQFSRRVQAKDNAQVGIQQPLNLPLAQFHRLRLRLVLQVNYHSLSGGGAGSVDSEYPLIVKLTYRDQQNTRAAWYQGFYLHNAERRPVPHGQLVPEGQWYSYEVDLLTLRDNQGRTVEPAPVMLETLDVYAEGHDFESHLALVSIDGE